MTQLTDNIYAAQVLEGARGFDFANGETKYLYYYHLGQLERMALNVPTLYKYQIIGLSHELSEVQARELVEQLPGIFDEPVFYKDYTLGVKLQYAVNSLRSLLESKGLTPDKNSYLILKRVDNGKCKGDRV